MPKNNVIRNLALFAVIAGIAGITAVGAIGPQGGQDDPNGMPAFKQFNPEKRGKMQEHRQAMKTVLESGDYNAFIELVGDKPIAEKVTAENFSRFVEMHNLMQAGDKEGAKAIAEELGIPPMSGKGMFMRHNGGRMAKFFKGGGFKDVDGDGICTFEENKAEVSSSVDAV